MRAFEFLTEKPEEKPETELAGISKKLDFINAKLTSGEITDPETIDFIYKILNKSEIQDTIKALVGQVTQNDSDVKAFQKANNDVLVSILRKMPVTKEEMDNFLKKWDDGDGFVNYNLLKSGQKGTIAGLIEDPIALKVFEQLEKIRSVYRMPKKGTVGYGEFGLAMLSPYIKMKAPGDIEIAGKPVECKGNGARLYADERTAKGLAEAETDQPQDPNTDNTDQQKKGIEPEKPKKKPRGSEPGLLNNIFTALQEGDPDGTVSQEVINSFLDKGVNKKSAEAIVDAAKVPGANIEDLMISYWKASFNDYVSKIKMPILLMGAGEFYMSSNPENFINWGCTPKISTPSQWGYVYGRAAGQSRETYSRIYLPSLK
jgi:hypothetical protein